ncbi:phage tail assembly chaperone [Altericroceibacterium spongiae]|uniref:Phage tail assembly chaperone n=1 Tax=Altericroceibacterium spongiae TaxID=2320269 RepID=A0A420EIT2_9SPHN|nr:phage tail assembly chaperone [Altericroceibacterium spongiae]RKF20578.1 phage tail assembly chaperone [Altericroceibacterium spongiae]
MSERFAAHALRLASITGQLWHWRPDEFWQATPAEIVLLFTPPDSDSSSAAPLNRTDIDRMMEQERHG